jgi:hypothetical protein
MNSFDSSTYTEYIRHNVLQIEHMQLPYYVYLPFTDDFDWQKTEL